MTDDIKGTYDRFINYSNCCSFVDLLLLCWLMDHATVIIGVVPLHPDILKRTQASKRELFLVQQSTEITKHYVA
ncbi:hypothetical protein BC833DRAFT_626017 [Globomyces pollinis-pini]|nr:hypothetical protein BC833DRAFT_626017 [Globomyces pollinis-pini]